MLSIIEKLLHLPSLNPGRKPVVVDNISCLEKTKVHIYHLYIFFPYNCLSHIHDQFPGQPNFGGFVSFFFFFLRRNLAIQT